jgi:ABC-type sugar transport system substrate-binding protein
MASVLLASCDGPSPDRSRRLPKETGFMVFVGAGPDDTLWPVLRASAQRFDRASGRYEVRYETPPITSSDKQVALIQSLASPSLRGICVQVVDSRGLVPALNRVQQSGTRIITIGDRVEGVAVDGHVGVNEDEVGRALAEATARCLDSRGAVMVLHGGDRSTAMRDRYRAFQDAARTYRQVEVWNSIDYGGSPMSARQAIVSWSSRYPSLSAWVSMAPWPVMNGPASSETRPSLPAGCKIITCMAEPSLWPHVESGLCPYAVAFDYGEAGAKAMDLCQVAMQSTMHQPRGYAIPVRIISAASLEEYKRDWARWATPPPP